MRFPDRPYALGTYVRVLWSNLSAYEKLKSFRI